VIEEGYTNDNFENIALAVGEETIDAGEGFEEKFNQK
jgi:hypothetical protein